jgi:hypothetical protein
MREAAAFEARKLGQLLDLVECGGEIIGRQRRWMALNHPRTTHPHA